ncbi:unnamed protein product [Amoebophrya sp. A120]|nr:unnamed protein product [Amoebophrya sp. A120]|eukprot:GSA120T00008949001.1
MRVLFPGESAGQQEPQQGSAPFTSIRPATTSSSSTSCITAIIAEKTKNDQSNPCSPYRPRPGDDCLGIVLSKRGEVFKLDIGSISPAELSETAFNGATKRNKPSLEIGDTIFCHVETVLDGVANVSCTDDGGKSFVTKETLYGALQHGYIIDHFPVAEFSERTDKTKTHKVDALLDSSTSNKAIAQQQQQQRKNLFPRIFRKLEKSFVFEVAVGMNNRVYIRSNSSLQDTFFLGKLLEKIGCEGLTDAQVEVVLRRVATEHGVLAGKLTGAAQVQNSVFGKKKNNASNNNAENNNISLVEVGGG